MQITRPRLLLFFLFTVIGLLFFTSYELDDLARMHYGTAPQRFIEEMTGAYTVWLLVPLIARVARRYPFTLGTWRAALPTAIAAGVAFTLAHTTLMALTRAIVFPLAGLGAYDYGLMIYRYPMEAAKDVIVFAIITGSVNLFAQLERGRAAELAAADLHTRLAEARLENLRLQLNPHFLFNTLNAISAVMYEDVVKADEMLAKLSDFLRIVLESSGVQNVSLADEVRVERMYVDIMCTRLERQLNLEVLIAPEVGAAEIPFMLLQPLLENSIRHGLHENGHALTIQIAARHENDLLVIDVTDDGRGYIEQGRRGHGLQNVEARLTQTFGRSSTFSIGARPTGGTHVRLAYPISIAGTA